MLPSPDTGVSLVRTPPTIIGRISNSVEEEEEVVENAGCGEDSWVRKQA